MAIQEKPQDRSIELAHAADTDDTADTAYAAMLAELFVRSGSGIKLGLEPMQSLLAALGHPEARIPRAVVVTGTNGKGSVSSMLAATLKAAGHRVGLYTSPHLLRFTERMRVGGVEPSAAKAVELYRRVVAVEAQCQRPPTYFECVTAMAIDWFAEQHVDIAVIEVGIGGSRDATQVVPRQLAVVTPISLDHQSLLGNTLGHIAADKAGIIPSGGTVVVAPQPEGADFVLERAARERGATWVRAAAFSKHGATLKLEHEGHSLELRQYPPAAYQAGNLATAWAACRKLNHGGIACSDEAFAQMASEFVWPGRYQYLAPDVLIDAAHNPGGVATLLVALGEDPALSDAAGRARPIHAVFSALQDKPGELMAAQLAARVRQFYLCPIPVKRGREGGALRALVPGAPVFADVAAAIAAARAAAQVDGGIVLITGSIFLIAEAMGHLTHAKRDPSVPF